MLYNIQMLIRSNPVATYGSDSSLCISVSSKANSVVCDLYTCIGVRDGRIQQHAQKKGRKLLPPVT